MLAVAPAGAAGKPSRSNGAANRVIFVHGYAPLGKHDCTKTFSDARKHFTNKKWKGNLLTFGYYTNNKNCSYNVGGSRETPIKDVAKKFANHVSKNYTEKGIKVDVVAHSMGGLVVRSALHYTHKRAAGFPKKLYIEDVVTLGTPHAGITPSRATLCGNARQCKDLKAGSAFLKALPSKMPSTTKNGNMSTDWTTISSYNDGTVSESSGVAGTANHEVQYKAGINHGELITTTSGTHTSRIKHSGKWSKFSKRVSPVEQARLAVYHHSTT
ncbi:MULTISPECIES: esterase/lipase family protein [unclassified Streptomyces]|uniref:esterase/lipase family protein n=1 Tax=unclassified Streptomyces TaxID=2593676 RepID=UPI00081E5F31|nr:MULTISPECIES: alpha/beta hydrolase [unclassified Streptomyces]MYR97516.1 alpha/beta hydrolase [Streptomyces sp. SID4937]SCE26589.1 Putative serine esterase [Streptomyces sp. ScaeMP-e83]